MDLELRGNVIVVVGGAGDLGQVVCEYLRQEEGAIVEVADIVNGDDMADEDHVRRYFERVAERHGSSIDGLVTMTYGKTEGQPFHRTTLEQYQKEMRACSQAAFLSSREALQWMKHGGNIVFVSSVNALLGLNEAAYDAAKATLGRFAADINAGYSNIPGIYAVTLCPGTVIGTPSWVGREADITRIARGMPDGRLTTAKDLARVIAFHLSALGELFGGHTIPCDRGWSIFKSSREWKDMLNEPPQ